MGGSSRAPGGDTGRVKASWNGSLGGKRAMCPLLRAAVSLRAMLLNGQKAGACS